MRRDNTRSNGNNKESIWQRHSIGGHWVHDFNDSIEVMDSEREQIATINSYMSSESDMTQQQVNADPIEIATVTLQEEFSIGAIGEIGCTEKYDFTNIHSSAEIDAIDTEETKFQAVTWEDIKEATSSDPLLNELRRRYKNNEIEHVESLLHWVFGS